MGNPIKYQWGTPGDGEPGFTLPSALPSNPGPTLPPWAQTSSCCSLTVLRTSLTAACSAQTHTHARTHTHTGQIYQHTGVEPQLSLMVLLQRNQQGGTG